MDSYRSDVCLFCRQYQVFFLFVAVMGNYCILDRNQDLDMFMYKFSFVLTLLLIRSCGFLSEFTRSALRQFIRISSVSSVTTALPLQAGNEVVKCYCRL